MTTGPSTKIRYFGKGKIHADTYRVRAIVLNGMTYDEYLKSDRWAEIKAKTAKRPYYSKCLACQSVDRINLHHKNYRFIGTHKELTEIIPLCADCHIRVHEIAKTQNIPVPKATSRYMNETKRFASEIRKAFEAALVGRN